MLCFDGTGDSFDLDNSNVVQLFSVLTKGERRRQLCYYQVRSFSLRSCLGSRESVKLTYTFTSYLCVIAVALHTPHYPLHNTL